MCVCEQGDDHGAEGREGGTLSRFQFISPLFQASGNICTFGTHSEIVCKIHQKENFQEK